ncbi:esterase-like activity of phytase family protein [Methyloceanibacter caenitepidi]|uniref:Mll3560 protein n=1 Tax=Methyloceanibacter caenitepidi TaxID=1384459 RepID=A0A0A8K726_9HYPH|nr:esterase-like activity of phytase family protein [Methyloceanibacter caenitepidi]BAQ18725.1 Mll3560 protein [Methyloceanibacter caenitepidi]
MRLITDRTTAALAAGLAGIAVLYLSASALLAKPTTPLSGPTETRVSVVPITFDRDDPKKTRFGKLIYRGGLNLFARSVHFGGYSALALDPSGTTLLALSDAGSWMRATLVYDGSRLASLSNVMLGPILDQDGNPLSSENRQDAEGMALLSGDTLQGSALVSFERDHRIMRYPFTPDRFGPPNGTVPLPKAARAMGSNQGLEAIATIQSGRMQGTVVALPEYLRDRAGNLIGWLIGGPSPGAITIRRLKGFDITDAAGLPDGGLLLLERRFRYSEGVKMRIRRIAPADLKPGKLITGETLLETDDLLNIDNMEAIAVHRAQDGATVLTLMSDDNFSAFQRSLIMQFTLP